MADHARENFRHKYDLILAEEARVEGRILEAMKGYEKAIAGALDNGFIHEAALAYELTAKCYLGHDMQESSRLQLLQASALYAQWGAAAKVRDLAAQFPHWLMPEGADDKAETGLDGRLDAITMVKASQAVSSEIELAKLIQTLMINAVENAGADRGLLATPGSDGMEVEAEARAGENGILVTPVRTPITDIDCAHSIINTTTHTLKSIIIDDSSHPESMADDPYLRQGKAKSILCLPLIRHGNLAGVLYLENSQTPGVFNQNRLAVLDVLATQAAISLENSHLYDTRRESEEKFRALLQKVQAAVVVHGTDTQILTANTMAQDLLGLSEAQLLGKTAIDPDWHFLREDESLLPPEEFPVNRVLASKHALQNTVIGIDRPDRIEILWALVNAAPLFNETGGITHVIVSFSDISERKRAEQQLTASEQLFRTLVENSPDHIARYDLNLRRVYLNPALQKLFTAPLNQVLQKTSKTDSPLLDPKAYMANLQQVIDSGLEISDEIAFRTAQGQVHWANSRFAPELNTDGKVQSVLVISNDITEQKQAEIERLDHMHFLESLDRINRVLQTQGTFEKTMSTALSEVLDIFDCDRACLIYPCDPDAETWSVPLESTRPAFPGAGPHGPQPMEEEMAAVMRALLEKERPLRIGPEGDYPITPLAREKYNTRAVLATILRPKADKPWQFGLQQCSHERSWSDQEVRLFEEIGHRLSDGLNSLLSTRDMRQSEARFRLVFESSPVSIQEEDYSAVKAHLESLRPEYGDDLATYLVDHPQVAHECAALVRIIDINQAALRLHQAGTKEEFLRDLPQIFIPETVPAYRQILVSLMRGETHLRVESEIRTLTGQRHPIDIFISVCSGYEQSLGRVLVSLVDISEIKQAEQERQEHLHFLKSLDRINKVLQSEGSIEEILKRTLDEVLDIFDCDRTYLQYPCDPDASAEWWMPMERCKPEYPSTLAPGGRLPYHPHIEETLRAMRDRDTPIRLGPETDHPIPAEITENLGVRSLLAIALRPKVDRPWHFGIHQCSHDRIWTDQESRLFQEIAHRFSDGLNNLLITRDLRESEERFRLVYENSPVSVREEDFSAVKSRLDEFTMNYGDDLEDYLLAHPESVKECAALVRIVNVNNATLELHEADSKAELFDGLPKTFIPESYDAFRKELMAIAKGETELILDGVVQTLSGKRRDVSISFSVCPGYEDKLSKVFVSMFDITQRKVDEENLRLAASVFSTSQEGILISDADNRIIDINPAFTRLTGYSREETLGQNPSFLSAGRQNPTFYAEMWQSIHSTGEWQGEIWNQRKSGEIFPELLSIVAIKDDQGRLQHYVGAFTDISMIKQHEADLDRIAHYDMLTSVPNRRLLGDRLEQAIAHARRHEKNLAVCYLDLDGFKPINDQFGHEGGDRMLIEIAHRLETMSRAEDTVSRLGGDEFVLLWSDIGSETDCANALERVLNKVAEPMLLDNQMASVSASIGVTLYPDDNVDADSLLRHADHAMYMAKQLGKNRYQIFDARLERQISAQVELMEKISRGLERGQFELYYQPKVDYTTCETVGAEALLRWNDPVLGLVGPKEFISLIENDILAFRMGRWVMEQAIQQARIWYEKGITLPISINVFPRHLKNRTFVDDLRSTIASIWPQMPRNQLVIEIVETNDLEELEPIEQVIKQCLGMGIGFSLDDFGTGYSSLVYLRRLSIQELKIDQSFVRDMLEDPEDEAIVVGVIRLGQAFGLQVVAEGVETTEQAQYLVDIGCHIVQGYGMGRPMPAHTLEKWYAAFNAMELNVCRK
ncbi:MAG: hypothetical protein B6D77_18415 [gamma proteobacterium symbiont of Ctena orbiculata]|nr:MAG: hypothetical protein B6D77_18415 [gamma proteobacterium symbiont of Ctena orbiculata]